MLVPDPHTWSSGELVDGALMNTEVRDALNFLLAPPQTILRQTGTLQAIPSATYTAVTWNTEDLDRDAMHSTVTNSARVTCTTAGYYTFNATVVWVINGTGDRLLQFRANGDDNLKFGSQTIPAPNGGAGQGLTISADRYLNVGDYVEVMVYQSSGGSLSLSASHGGPRFSARWTGK